MRLRHTKPHRAGVTGGRSPGRYTRPTCWSLRLAGLHRTDPVRPHHLVVLVLDDVAVPDELALVVELQPEPGDLIRVANDRVLEAALPGLGPSWLANGMDVGVPFLVKVDRLPVHDLERHLVHVHGVSVGGHVVELP